MTSGCGNTLFLDLSNGCIEFIALSNFPKSILSTIMDVEVASCLEPL